MRTAVACSAVGLLVLIGAFVFLRPARVSPRASAAQQSGRGGPSSVAAGDGKRRFDEPLPRTAVQLVSAQQPVALPPTKTKAERMDEDAVRLAASVRAEPRDVNWARATEARIRQALADKYPSANVIAIECATRRCLIEGSAKFSDIPDALRDAARSADLRNGRIRSVRAEDGTASFRSVLVKGGFDVEGNEARPPSRHAK